MTNMKIALRRMMKIKIGLMFKIYRRHYFIPIRELAKDLGVSPATLSRFENGGNIDGKTLSKILKYLL